MSPIGAFPHKERNGTGWIQTFTGKQFWPLDPRPEEVDIHDIGHALSLQCRFTGHLKHFYSVAQHSVMASWLVPPEDKLWALLHDGSEAYLVDVATPVKRSPEMAPYRQAEKRLMDVIVTAFGLPIEEPSTIKPADLTMLVTEKRDLLDHGTTVCDWGRQYDDIPRLSYQIKPWTASAAEYEFLAHFTTYSNRYQ